MAMKFAIIVLLTLLSANSQALVAKDSLDEDVAFELELGEQPWLSLLALPGGVSCSGVIVSPTSVLSAAVCLQGVAHPTHGVAYAGNVKYRVPKDFDPPTQNRSVVDFVFYNENNTLEYNIVLVKITPKWIWSISVQPVGVIDVERLPDNFSSSCLVSGLGAGDSGSSQVARSASALLARCARSPQPHDHLMCSVDPGFLAPRAGDVGGPVLCESEPEYKLYGIISEHSQNRSEQLLDPLKIPSRGTGFQYVGYYRSWINNTAGDLPSEAEVISLKLQHENELPLPLGVNGMFPEPGRQKRGGRTPTTPPTSSEAVGGPTSETDGGEGGEGGEGGGNGNGNNTAGNGAGRVCLGSCALPLLAAPLALAVRALF